VWVGDSLEGNFLCSKTQWTWTVTTFSLREVGLFWMRMLMVRGTFRGFSSTRRGYFKGVKWNSNGGSTLQSRSCGLWSHRDPWTKLHNDSLPGNDTIDSWLQMIMN
jgi:hypothetical protein